MPTRTTFAGHDGDGWDWRKWLAAAALTGTVYKLITGRRVGLAESLGLAAGLWGLFGPS